MALPRNTVALGRTTIPLPRTSVVLPPTYLAGYYFAAKLYGADTNVDGIAVVFLRRPCHTLRILNAYVVMILMCFSLFFLIELTLQFEHPPYPSATRSSETTWGFNIPPLTAIIAIGGETRGIALEPSGKKALTYHYFAEDGFYWPRCGGNLILV